MTSMSTPKHKCSYLDSNLTFQSEIVNILPKATLLENHALRGRNRESSTRRPPDIPYQGTDIYEKGTTLQYDLL